ncbi:MAG: carboxypeptidase-like regulatory domain-containing protein [Gemmatimonadaceae bacterium]
MKAAAALLGLLFAPVLPAQAPASEVSIRVVSTSGNSTAGALVALVDMNDRVVAEGISSASGLRRFSAPRGTYRVRVRRIGFLPFVSDPVPVPNVGELVLRVDSRRVTLKSVLVTAKSTCRTIDQNPETVAVVWKQIETALNASQLTAHDLTGLAHARTYRRRIGPGETILSNDTTVVLISDNKPFGAIDPATLASKGYVQGDMFSGWEFFGPDETVFLSREFAETHCFRVVREKRRPGQIGVAFEPVRGRKTSDIAGAMWVDEGTAELREMKFQYVNVGVLERHGAGGFTRFRRMASGAWLIDEWQIRMPGLEMPAREPGRLVAVGRWESGGGIVLGSDMTGKKVSPATPLEKR